MPNACQKRLVQLALPTDRNASSKPAVHACGRGTLLSRDLWSAVRNQVTCDAAPDLFQLVRQLGNYETAAVAVADSNTLRVFVVSSAALEEVRDEIAAEVQSVLRAAGRAEDTSLVDDLVALSSEAGLGVIGETATR